MAWESLRSLVRRLRRRLADAPGEGALSDAGLLERFVGRRDEAAFEVLVWRHGAMVLGLCRRLLGHEQDAEDAFQATFLLLARKAGSIGRREALAAWLHRVAYRVALAARARAAGGAAREQPWVDLPAREADDALAWRDLRPVLDEEVGRLPEKYRAAFVLCCLEGKTNEEAAEALGCPLGTVLSRLARARERLRRALTRRGVTLTAGLSAALLAGDGLAAEVSASMVQTTVIAALPGATGKAAAGPVAALVEGVLRAMFISKLKTAAAALLFVTALGFGAAAAGQRLLAGGADEGKPRQKPPAEKPAPEGAKEAEDPLKVAARMLQSRQNLKQIGLALLNFYDTMGSLPAPANYEGNPTGAPPGAGKEEAKASAPGGTTWPPETPARPAPPGKIGKPLLSWRVAILPWIGEDKLYKEFKRDQPWDSPHNKKLLARMPKIYAPVTGGAREAGLTYYQALVGPGAGFESGRGLRLSYLADDTGKEILTDFKDGPGKTLLVVEAAVPVPWTKPEDLPYVPDQALPRLGGLFGGDFHAVMGDGTVRLLSRRVDKDTLRRLISRNDGMPVDLAKAEARLPGLPEGGKVTLDQATRMNARLKETIQSTRDEMAQARDELKLLKARLELGAPGLDPKALKVLEENAKLQETLGKVLDELEALKEERARLRKELDRRFPQKEE